MARRRVLPPLVATLLLVCLAGAANGRGADEAAEPWGTVVVPGGAAAVRQAVALGSTDRPVVNLVADLARRLNSTPIGRAGNPADVLVPYFDYLHTLRRHLDGIPGGLSLAMTSHADRDVRNAFRDAVELLGLRRETRDDLTYFVVDTDDRSVQRVKWLESVGVSTADVAARLGAGATVTITWREDAVPLPLPALWRTLVFERDRDPMGTLVGSPRALRFYLGLVSLDEATRAWLEAEPDTFRRLHDDLALPFSVFGRSIRVVDGRVDVPGGADALPIWEDLADGRASEPASFIRRLLERDAGRLAYFYDLAAHLDPPRRNFLLGAHLGPASGRERIQFVRRVFDRIKAFDSTWEADKLPFFKPALDPALVLSAIDVTDGGEIGPRWWPALLERVASDQSWPDRVEPVRLREGIGDADWVLRWVFDSTDQSNIRYQMLRFLQRTFAGAPASAAPEIDLALRARRDMPALALSLERLGIENPGTYASVALASRRLTEAGDPPDVAGAMRVWQGSLALVEQAARHRRLAPGLADTLLRALVEAEPARPAEPQGAVVAWLFDVALPGLGLAGELAEADAIASILRPDAAGELRLEWEGLPYRLDATGPAIQAALRIRLATPGPRLEQVAALRKVSRQLATPGSLESLEALQPILADLRAVHPSLEHVRDHDGEARAFNRLRDVIRTIERIERPRDLERAARETRDVLRVLDATAADVVSGLAYALALVPTANPPQIYSDAHRVHFVGVGSHDVDFRVRAWEVPRVEPRETGGTHVTGALLGLDVARAAEQLRRVVVEAPRPPVISEPDQVASAQRVVLRAGGNGWAAEGAAVASAIARGRETVAGWKTTPGPTATVEARLRDAKLSEWRVSMAVALVSTGRTDELNDFFTLTDFYRLGSTDALPAAWGQSGWYIEGCWCLRPLDRRAPEDWLGRTLGLSGSVTGDLPLRVTELLAEFGLPHQLLEPILLVAVQDLLDNVRQASNDDWESLAWPRRLTRERVEEYLLNLVSEGTLAAPRPNGGGSPRP